MAGQLDSRASQGWAPGSCRGICTGRVTRTNREIDALDLRLYSLDGTAAVPIRNVQIMNARDFSCRLIESAGVRGQP